MQLIDPGADRGLMQQRAFGNINRDIAGLESDYWHGWKGGVLTPPQHAHPTLSPGERARVSRTPQGLKLARSGSSYLGTTKVVP